MDSNIKFEEKVFAIERFIELPHIPRSQHFSRAGARLLLVLTDLCSLLISFGLAFGLARLLGFSWEGSTSLILKPLLLVFTSAYVLLGFYGQRSANQVEEIRELAITMTMVLLILLAYHLVMGETKFSPILFGLSWLIAIVLGPLARIGVRLVGSNLGVWGEPVVIIGGGKLSRRITRHLLKNPYYGLRPVMMLDVLGDDVEGTSKWDFPIPRMPLESWLTDSSDSAKFGIRKAIVLASELPSNILQAITGGEYLGFTNIITVSEHFNTRNVGIIPLDFGGVLGLEERHYLLNFIEVLQVRILDLALILSALPVLAPFFLAIAIAIKLDSKGSVVYRHTRIGKEGRAFQLIKFRTMVENADEVLQKCLEDDPDLLAEWERNHKLKNDPRITRVGRILRKLSLDELPQVLNVIKGEMSLVGPRPIVTDEIQRYADRYKYYLQVPPGITGLWQVSGRNDVDYDRRVMLDEYYVRNRSIWLNLYIIMRTVLVVIRRQGAY